MNRIARSPICCTTFGLVVAASLLPVAAADASSNSGHGGPREFAGALRDLQPGAVGPLDRASARLTMAHHHGGSKIVLKVKGIDTSAAGHQFGAHLHIGPCVAGNGALAGPHYNTEVLAHVEPPKVDKKTEVWLDFTVTPGGRGRAVARVPFVPKPGERAIVIHRDATDGMGVAGPRLACLPLTL